MFSDNEMLLDRSDTVDNGGGIVEGVTGKPGQSLKLRTFSRRDRSRKTTATATPIRLLAASCLGKNATGLATTMGQFRLSS